MDDGFGFLAVIGAIFVWIFRICEGVYHAFVFVFGLRWLSSRKVRERTAAEGLGAKLTAFEGVLYVAIVVAMIVGGIVWWWRAG